MAGTAWNGAMKSTDEEWKTYLTHRRDHNYNTIQIITTQFRGLDKNAEGLVAFDGGAEITINPEFFKRMDKKIDEINSYGLLASPAILWAIQYTPAIFNSQNGKLIIEQNEDADMVLMLN